MFKLESKRLKREFKITNNTFYASQIQNKYSGMSFVPDGNGSEFVVFFDDGTQLSSKGLPVVDSSEENKKLRFVFAESKGVSVTLEYWVHEDENTICKQLTLSQSNDKIIDRVFLDNIGIINSQTHFSLDPKAFDETNFIISLGQPFYIDSLFFGCEFPGADSKIIHGAGQIRYYIGRNVGRNFKCPVTVMGGGKDNTITEVKKAFNEYLDFISIKRDLRFTYINDTLILNKKGSNEENIKVDFSNVLSSLNAPDMPEFSDCVFAGENWADYSREFWSFNKLFPNRLDKINEVCRKNGAGLGITLNPNGYHFFKNKTKKFSKAIQKAGNGFVNDAAKEICTASNKYVNKLGDFLYGLISEYNLTYLRLGSFGSILCANENHDHLIGGKNNMYCISDMLESRIELFEKIRRAKSDIWINLDNPDNFSPWWLKWVNSFELTGNKDIEAVNYEEQPAIEAELTCADSEYYDCLCKKSLQLPLNASCGRCGINGISGDYSLEEFAKYIMWSAVRGQSLYEINLELEFFEADRREMLSKALKFQKENSHILKNASFIGGNPMENNIYGYVSWTQDGEGIVALRNPTKEKASLTLTFNKLMGVPENFSNARRENVFCFSVPETDELISYNEKLDLTMHPFEIIIFKFSK